MKKAAKANKPFIYVIALLSIINTFPCLAQSTSPLGDVNGDSAVTIVDALLVAQYYVGLNPANFSPAQADANASGSIDIIDALVIAQFYVGLITSLPPGSTPASTQNPTPAATADSTPAPTIAEVHLANPFAGAKMYVNPEWSSHASSGGGAAIANFNTAIWLDSIASIAAPYFGGMGLRGHLDAALAQGANLITLVLYNLPNRDCSREVSSGELIVSENGLARYKTEFIDPIRAIVSDTKYSEIRIIAIVEPDSLVHLVTEISYARCAEVAASNTYANVIQYALNSLRSIPNVYLYMDIAFSGWCGWDTNRIPTADLISNVVKNSSYGVNAIAGLTCNIAQYSPIEEPFLPDTALLVGGQQVKSARFCDWNPFIDELDYAQEMYRLFVERGFPSTIGILVDTSRNGWGGPARPVRVSTSTDVNTYVDESRIDRRYHRANWCNQNAGLGARPQANPNDHIHAFLWIKAPGISDGASTVAPDPQNPYLVFDTMCDPNGINRYCNCGTTGAMPNAPSLGRWFQASFDALLANAYPPVN